MFIELTDHLKCIADHAEQFVVLLPDRMDGRRVMAGTVGCPVCGTVVPVVEGEMDFGGPIAPMAGQTSLTAETIVTFLGLDGPGGFIAIVGGAGESAAGVSSLMPGARLVLVNPPPGVTGSETTSVVRAGRLPIKASSMRGVVVSADHGADPAWVTAAVEAGLPGNRVVVESTLSPPDHLEVLARTDHLWVARKPVATLRR